MSRFKGFTSNWMKAVNVHAQPNGVAKKLVPDKPKKKLTKKDIQKAIRKVSSKPKWEKSNVDPKDFIEYALKDAGLEFVKEFKFAETRKFRFDYFVPSLMLGIEYNGIMSEKSRHLTLTGFSRDKTKQNLAQQEGYKIFEYTVLNYRDIVNDLKQLIKQ